LEQASSSQGSRSLVPVTGRSFSEAVQPMTYCPSWSAAAAVQTVEVAVAVGTFLSLSAVAMGRARIEEAETEWGER
jgi:hypothetical protein